MATKVKTKTRARVKAKRATSTALVRRKAAAPTKPKPKKKAIVLPNVLPEAERNLSDDIMLGGLGLQDIKLTPDEERILGEAVDPHRIMVKPTGQPYLSHPTYTQWFGRAFGRLGWALVPVSKPSKALQGKRISVVVPYVLYIHGSPAAFAHGEQDYYENNAEQTYGDALESTVASALRRCAKRLGVGLEMWDKRFLEQWLVDYCVHVQIEVKERGSETKKKSWVWRRRDAKPFWNEIGRSASRRRDEPRNDPERDEPSGIPGFNAPPLYEDEVPADAKRVVPADARATHAAEGEKITLPQRQRLAMIVNNSDRSDVEVNDWLRDAYGIRNEKPTRDILRRDYDAIVRALESPGALPKGRAK